MSNTNIRPSDIIQSVKDHPFRLIVPVILVTLVASGYVLIRPVTWEASQALVVRDEAGDRLSRPGKFTHADEMKTSQETILELARSRTVLSRALVEIGPPDDSSSPIPWPSDQQIEVLQSKVKIAPPKGAEFGKTEVFYLKVQDTSQARAVALASAICRQLQVRLGELRESKADSTTNELTKTVSLAQADLEISTRALSAMEQHVGSDLAELRILNESPSGDSDLRRTATELEKELRTLRGAHSENEEFLKLLKTAQVDPNMLLASPSVLMKAQPALGRLKDGLVDAQLRTGQLLGTMSTEHPTVKSARASEQAIHRQLHDELAVAIQGVEVDLRVSAERIRSLEQQNDAIQARLGRLATVRAEYANLVAAAKSRGENLKAVDRELAEARASQAAARTASLINLVDSPDAGTRPLGPGRSLILLTGMGGGLLIGVAIVFLTLEAQRVPHTPSRGPLPIPLAQPNVAVSLNLKQALQRVSRNRI